MRLSVLLPFCLLVIGTAVCEADPDKQEKEILREIHAIESKYETDESDEVLLLKIGRLEHGENEEDEEQEDTDEE